MSTYADNLKDELAEVKRQCDVWRNRALTAENSVLSLVEAYWSHRGNPSLEFISGVSSGIGASSIPGIWRNAENVLNVAKSLDLPETS